MQITKTNEAPIVKIDASKTMYPTIGYMIEDDELILENTEYSTLYGYSFGKSRLICNGLNVDLFEGEYFSLPSFSGTFNADASSKLMVIERKGYHGQKVIGCLEDTGRLCYIDGCSDSMLVYPPRFGDSTLNSLHFPPNIAQSFHTHPSIRIGCVASGKGRACSKDKEHEIKQGDLWLIEEQELHRFRTDKDGEKMIVIAFHPDSEWGPTDHNHTMLNRTYINKG